MAALGGSMTDAERIKNLEEIVKALRLDVRDLERRMAKQEANASTVLVSTVHTERKRNIDFTAFER